MYQIEKENNPNSRLFNCLKSEEPGKLLGIYYSATEEWSIFATSIARTLGISEEGLEDPRRRIILTTTALLAGNSLEDISCSEHNEKGL